MKVLIITTTHSYKHALRPEMEYFIEMHRRGLSIDICTQTDSDYSKILIDEGIAIVGDFPKSKNDKRVIQQIRTLLKKNNYDIIYSLHSKAIACSLKAAKGLNVKIVVYRGASGQYWHDPSAYNNALNPRVDKVICVCDDIRDNLRKQLFFKKDKAVTVYKGHRIEWYQDIKAADREQLGVKSDDFVMACTANNRKWKGIPTLLDAMDLLPQDSKIKLLLIGHGMDSPYYVNKIKNNKNRDKIITLGYRDDAMPIAKASDIILQTSYKNEGLSKGTIEGMALDCAPIVTDAGGNDELVLNNETGLVVPTKDAQAMANAIIKLYESPSLVQKFKDASYERICKVFTVEKTTQETIEIFKDLIK